MNTISIPVKTRPEYQVRIGPGLLPDCGRILWDTIGHCRVAVVTDDAVGPLYLDDVRRSLENAGFSVCAYAFPAGEEHKNLSTLGGILEFLARERLTRSDALIALGGGVVGDMAGFAAAVYLRGIRYVQMPTTLLAAVDSSVGGKTAVDLRAGKNLAGAFAQPAAVLCDTDFLRTLPPETFADGMAEVIKTGVLSGESLLSMCQTGDLSASQTEVVARCVAYKAGVVERDEREQGERRLLNLGHTVGHAIEKCSAYTIPHGHAVAAGLGIIARASEALGWTAGPIAARVCECLTANGLPCGTDFAPEALAEAALSDKKRAGDNVVLVIPERVGGCVLKTVSVGELPGIIRRGCECGRDD